MYSKPPDAADLAKLEFMGLSTDDYPDEVVEIWPENLSAYTLFNSMSTQWRVGMAGPTGLDYFVAYHRMDRMGLTAEEYEQLDQDLQVMEAAALAVMRQATQ